MSLFAKISSCLAVLVVASSWFGPAQAQEAAPQNLDRHIYPLAPALAQVPTVSVDISDDPAAKDWAERAKKIVVDWFPLVWRMLATDGLKPPAEIKIIFKKKINAPAYATGNTLVVNGEWIAAHPDDFGMMVHELTHIVQSYPPVRSNPGWLVEGIADFIRWWRYEPESPRTRIDPNRNSYRDGYRVTAAFLAWLTSRYDHGIVPRLDKALREGNYSDELFKTATGKDLNALWNEFAPKPSQPAAP